jgi:hypothetical protein
MRIIGLKIEIDFFEFVEDGTEVRNWFEKGLFRGLWCRNPDDILEFWGLRSN